MAADGPLAAYSRPDRFHHYLLAVLLCGALQVAAGVAGLSRVLKMVPRPVMVGFLDGLAIIIFKAQLEAFQTCPAAVFSDCAPGTKTWMSLADGVTWVTLAWVAATMLIMWFFPRVPRVGKAVPSSLVAILAVTILEHALLRQVSSLHTRTVAETAALDGLPALTLPVAPAAGWNMAVVWEYAAILAVIGLTESLMALQALHQLTRTPQRLGAYHQDCVAQGLGNIISALCGTVGGCTMIGQSTVNILAGARGRLSGATAALCVLAFASFAGRAIGLVPIAVLTGVLFVVVIKTFDWATLRVLHTLPRGDALTVVLVTVLAVTTNLGIAVVGGVAFAALAAAWRDATRGLTISRTTRDADGLTHYAVSGKLYFATTWELFAALEAGPATDTAVTLLDAGAEGGGEGGGGGSGGCQLLDSSAAHAVAKMTAAYRTAGKELRVVGFNSSSSALLAAAQRALAAGGEGGGSEGGADDAGVTKQAGPSGAVCKQEAALAASDVDAAVDVLASPGGVVVAAGNAAEGSAPDASLQPNPTAADTPPGVDIDAAPLR
jgi:SulP family sulfate permease